MTTRQGHGHDRSAQETATERRRARFAARYAQGDVPWDDELPPPEIIALGERLPPGRALDLGAGYGRAAIFLARHGWRVAAVDYVPAALLEARRRARAAEVDDHVDLVVAAVIELPFARRTFDLAIDVGCLHGLDAAGLRALRDQLARTLRPGGRFVAFTHLRTEDADARGGDAKGAGAEAAGDAEGGAAAAGEIADHPTVANDQGPPSGMDEALFRRELARGFTLERVEHGTTTAGGRGEIPSAWWWWRRHDAPGS